MMVLWVANTVLKGIAELTDFNFDLDARKAYIQTTLYGETEAIEILLEDFAIIADGESYQFIIQQARSNKLWLNNLFAHIVGRTWKIPAIPQLAAHMGLVAELLKAENTEAEEHASEPEAALLEDRRFEQNEELDPNFER